MTVGIYKITCTANDKIYVGQSVNIERRFGEHMRKPPKLMREDFETYGRQAFKFEILEVCEESQLNELERHYIGTLKPLYNDANGGGRNISMSMRILLRVQKGTKIKCVENGVTYDSIHQAESELGISRRCISWCLKGVLKTAGGLHFIYASETEPRPVILNKKMVPIICVETKEKFCSITAASKALGIGYSNIRGVLKSKQRTAGGYRFIYEGEEFRPITPNKHCKPVRCVELNQVFDSIKDASEITGLSRSSISNALSGRNHTAGNYHWEYVTKSPMTNSAK